MESATPSPEVIKNELLSLVKTVKEQLVNADNCYVAIEGRKTLLVLKTDAPVKNSNDSFDALLQEMASCRRCPLADTRKNVVCGDGNQEAKIVFVGEAPGADEDKQGIPFVGRAGQLLTDIIQAMGLKRKDVYICNVLKCRPPENRNPLPEEIRLCEPFLKRQLQLVSPLIICTLGAYATKILLKTEKPISELRGRFASYEGIPVMPTFHPAYLLRNPQAKRQTWEDVQMIMKEMGLKK